MTSDEQSYYLNGLEWHDGYALDEAGLRWDLVFKDDEVLLVHDDETVGFSQHQCEKLNRIADLHDKSVTDDGATSDEAFDRLFARFGWTITDEFRDRYWNDAWVYNLTNAALRLQDDVEQIKARWEALA